MFGISRALAKRRSLDFKMAPRTGVARLYRERLPRGGVAKASVAAADNAVLREPLDALTNLLSRFDGRIFGAYVVGSWKLDPSLFLDTAQPIDFLH